MFDHALVFGRADGVWAEIEAAKRQHVFDVVVAVGSVGIDYPGHIDCWVTYHANRFPQWVKKREAKQRPPAKQYWTARSTLKYKPIFRINQIECYGGDSGLIGTLVALRLARRVTLAGIPMDPERGQYDSAESRWDEALNHRAAWERHLPELKGRVTSMSGWTKQLLNGGGTFGK